jgi:hypothetical protein
MYSKQEIIEKRELNKKSSILILSYTIYRSLGHVSVFRIQLCLLCESELTLKYRQSDDIWRQGRQYVCVQTNDLKSSPH